VSPTNPNPTSPSTHIGRGADIDRGADCDFLAVADFGAADDTGRVGARDGASDSVLRGHGAEVMRIAGITSASPLTRRVNYRTARPLPTMPAPVDLVPPGHDWPCPPG
jgi:hypothetical protein